MPTRRAWPLIARRIGNGDPVSPSYTRRNVSGALKFTLANVGLKDIREFTSKAFLRGAAQERLATGNSLEVIKWPGGWRGAGFRSYVDIEMGHVFRISRALLAHPATLHPTTNASLRMSPRNDVDVGEKQRLGKPPLAQPPPPYRLLRQGPL